MNQKRPLPEWVFPLALIALAFITYGPLLSQLGFYWDDWVFAWTRTQLGIQGLVELFNHTRPIRGWMEAALTPILDVVPLRWQIYTLMMRSLASISFWWFLRQLWPERRSWAWFAAGILLVYPGFSQQPLAMTYNNYWTFKGLFFLSFALTVYSLRTAKPDWRLFAVSALLGILNLYSMEYFVGLEMLRPAVIFLALIPVFPAWQERLKKAILYEIPYALSLAGYLYWRFFLYNDSIYSPAAFAEARTNLSSTLTELVSYVANAIFSVAIQVWGRLFQTPGIAVQGLTLTLTYIICVLIIIIGASFLLHRAQEEKTSPAVDWILLGLAGSLFAGLPFFIAGLPFRLEFPTDRFSLPFIPLVGMFTAGMISLIPGRARQFLVAGFVLAFSAGYQIQNADIFRDQFKTQKSFYWQLAWRAPQLKPGTSILSEDVQTFSLNDDEAMTGILNWQYAPGYSAENFPYTYQFISLRLAHTLDDLLKTPETSQSLVVSYTPPGCLHVLDPRFDTGLFGLSDLSDVRTTAALDIPVVPVIIIRALPLSHPAQIISSGTQATPPKVFGDEPPHQWCYYYQKADLARQQGDWETVARLGNEAFAVPLQPDDPYEYLPFIEAYARLGRIKDARLLTRQTADKMSLLKPALCAVWERAGQAGLAAETVDKVKLELQICPVP